MPASPAENAENTVPMFAEAEVVAAQSAAPKPAQPSAAQGTGIGDAQARDLSPLRAFARELAAVMTRRDVNNQGRTFTEEGVLPTVEAVQQALWNLGKAIGDRNPTCDGCGKLIAEALMDYHAREPERYARAAQIQADAKEATRQFLAARESRS